MSNKLFWMMAYKDDGDFPRYDNAISIVNLDKKTVKCGSDKRLWINATKEDWEFLNMLFHGEVFSIGNLHECPEGTPLSFELNECITGMMQ